MKKILFSILIILFLVYFPVVAVYSQSQTGSPGSLDLESCFQYYDYAKVKVNLSEDKNSYQPNEKIRLRGTITNNNTFPIASVILYSQLKRINDVANSQSDNGDYLIDRITLKDNLSFLPHETKYMDIEIPVLPIYPTGNYKMEYYVFSKEGFHYSGRAFLENDVAGVTSFAISNDKAPLIYFDINNFKVNGIKTNLKEFGRSYNNSTFNFEVPIIDNRTVKSDLKAEVKYYYFEDDIESLLDKSEIVTIGQNSQILRTDFVLPSNLAAAYVVVVEIDAPVKTVFKFRFYKDGAIAKELRINDLGITDYPLADTSQAFVCFHSPANPSAPETTVKLTVLDSNNSVVDTKSVNSSFPADVLAIAVPLSKLTSKNNFYIKANLIDSSGTREIIRHYSDNLFNGSLKSIDIAPNTGEPGIITITLKDINGNTISNNTYLDTIRVIDSQGKMVQEQDSVTDLTDPFQLGNLPKGKYTIEAQLGDTKASKNIELTQDYSASGKKIAGYMNVKTQVQPNIKKAQPMLLAILAALVFIILGFGAYFIHKKNKIKQT